MNPSPRNAARILVDQWRVQGVNHVFTVPGECCVPVFDALLDAPTIRLIVNRHESGSGFMACAYARLTGQPGVALVARGPGATNAAIAVHAARQDSLPLVLFVGDVSTARREREAFQEIDLQAMFAPVAKWSVEAGRADRLPEIVARAFQVATSGRPGPVVVSIPEDVLSAAATVLDARCHSPVQAAPSDMQIAALGNRLRGARRPVLIAGGSGWTAAACANLADFARANVLPVVCAFRRQDLFDSREPNYVGEAGLGIDPRLAQRIRDSDLVMVFGSRLSEAASSGYALIDAPVPGQTLVHAHAGVEELGRVYQADLMINTGMPQLASRLAMMAPVQDPPWAGELAAARAEFLQWRERPAVVSQLQPALDPWEVVRTLREVLPDDAIVCNGAGNYAAWLHRFFDHVEPGTQLAPTGGAMGYAVPAAVAAKIVAPERTVVCVTGDGDFLMSSQELATAAQCNAGVVVVLFDNGMYGTIRMHQERAHPGRPTASALVNPDFAAMAKAYGGTGWRIERTAEFAPALTEAIAKARATRRPSLLWLACDPRLLSPSMALGT